MTQAKRGFILTLAAILLISAAWKALLYVWDVAPFNSDEAIVALMARHILQGQHMTWFYGQHYMGSLDAYLIAGGFALFGEQVWVVRLTQGLLYMGTLVTTALLWMHFAIRRMDVARHPEMAKETDLPEIMRAANAKN